MQMTPTRELREGQIIAKDARDERGRILLAQGQRLTNSLIQRLFRFRVENVYLRSGAETDAPELVKAEVKQKCQEILSEPFGRMTQIAAAKRLTLDAVAIARASGSLVDALMGQRSPLIALIDVNATSDALMQHSVSAAILAVTLALDMGVPTDMLYHLGAALLFHDIGLMYVPAALLAKTPPLAPEDIHALRDHARLGATYLLHSQAVSGIAANLVLRHHEAMDGSGYPEGIGGEKLTLLARIACVAEAYDSITSPRPYAPAVMPDVAITYMVSNANKLFARDVVIALCRRVALYPTGTAVQLNTGERGIVAGTPPNLPMRPTIQIRLDHRGKILPQPALLDLARDSGRCVVRSAPHLNLLDSEQKRVIVPQPILPVHALG